MPDVPLPMAGQGLIRLCLELNLYLGDLSKEGIPPILTMLILEFVRAFFDFKKRRKAPLTIAKKMEYTIYKGSCG